MQYVSYNVVQKIRNNYYLYEVTAEWDPVAKRSKQKRKYLGRCDEGGNLMTPTTVNVVCKNLGEYYLMHQVCIKSGLWNALCKVYGEDSAKYLFSHSVSRCLRSCPPTQSPYDIRASILPDFFKMPADSKRLSLDGYLRHIVQVYRRRQELFRELAVDDSAVVFDLETLVEPLQYYKLHGIRSHLNFNEFPQKSVFLAMGETTRLPFYYRMANYGGADVDSMRTVASELRGMSVSRTTFYMDDKPFSESEIGSYLSSDYDMVIILSKDSEFHARVCEKYNGADDLETLIYAGVAYKYKAVDTEFDLAPCRMFFVDNGRDCEEITISFFAKLDQFENTVSKLKWSKTLEKRLEINYGFSDIRQYFNLAKGEDDSIIITRNNDRIRRKEMSFGKSVIITDSKYDLKTILRLMIKADRFKQDMNIFRTDLQGGAALFPSNESAEASLMGDFLSMVMKSSLIDLINYSDLAEEMSYLDVISEAATIKAYWVNGVYGVTPATSEQKSMFERLGMTVPTAAMRLAQHSSDEKPNY